jgi:hypothetical protein
MHELTKRPHAPVVATSYNGSNVRTTTHATDSGESATAPFASQPCSKSRLAAKRPFGRTSRPSVKAVERSALQT